MPMSQGGIFRANPQQARASDAASVTPISKPAPAEDEQPSITISKTDSGFHFSEPGGEEGDLNSIEEVDAKVKECLGVEADSGDPGDEQAPGADAGMGY